MNEFKLIDARHLIALKQHVKAAEVLGQIQLRKDSDYADATRYLAHIEIVQNQHSLAAERLNKLLSDWGPDYKTLTLLAELKMHLGDEYTAIKLAEQALTLQPQNKTLSLNLAIWKSSQDQTPASVRANFETWCQEFTAPLSSPPPFLPNLDRDPSKKLKVGYVSGDLKNHAVRYFIEPYFKHHNASEFEVHVFMTGEPDVITDILKESIDHWHDVRTASTQDLHQLIRHLRIDILLDLSGHTAGGRLEVFALRAAPVQVTWWGFMQTLGLKEMDYRLTDSLFCPLGSEAHYTEGLCRMSCMTAYAPPLNCDEQHESPWYERGFVTMISLNHTRKISQSVLHLWRRVLEDNPNSGLIIVSTESTQEGADALLKPRLESINMPLDRIALMPRLNLLDFMNLASRADFALDSMPVSGGVTTFHSLWMGLPVLTIRPNTPLPLQSYTANILHTVGLHECVTTSEGEFMLRAKTWISKPEQLEEIRKRCRPQLVNSPFMDHASRARELEQKFRQLWLDYLKNI